MTTAEHRLTLHTQKHGEHERHVAMCACGWIGQTTETKAEAEQEGADHYRSATYGTDRRP